MRPSQIRRTAETALELLEDRGHGNPEAFLLAWVSWEGLKIRVISLGLARMGFQVQHVYEVLTEDELRSKGEFEALFQTVFSRKPQSAKGVGSTWQRNETFRKVRNRIVHGIGSTSPDRLESGTRVLTGAVLSPQWLGSLAVNDGSGQVSIGNPFAGMNARGGRSKEELRELVIAGRGRA